MEPGVFFAAFAKAMKANPPHTADTPMIADLARLGIVPGEDFDASKLRQEQQQAIDQGAHAASARAEK
jgi:hypothetical protein